MYTVRDSKDKSLKLKRSFRYRRKQDIENMRTILAIFLQYNNYCVNIYLYSCVQHKNIRIRIRHMNDK